MKRPFIGIILAIICLSVAVPAFARPLLQDQRPLIAQPDQNATVRGVVQIVGTATHPQFQRYELYYAPWPVPSDNAWIFIGPEAHFQQQALGLLGTWDSRAVPDGTYALRVRVVKKDANYIDSDPRQVVVANTKAADTPTPTVTTTPTGTPEATQSATQPTAPAVATVPPNKPASTGTPAAAGAAGAAGQAEPSPTPLVSSSNSTAATDATSALSGLFDVSQLADTAQTAAIYTLGIFVLVGGFFAVKALLVWLWRRIWP